jgi:hypothetical protein
MTLQAVTETEHVIKENHHIKVNEVAAMFDVSHVPAYHTTHGLLQFHIMSGRWVHRQLAPELKDV